MNQLWDPSLVALSDALAKGVMPNLRRLDMNSNHIGEPYLTDEAKRERQALLESTT